MKLYDKNWTRRELEARVGRIEQIGGLRRFIRHGGFETGVDAVEVRTGAGLRYVVNLSRGLDISLAEFGGAPLCWLAQPGDVHPAFYDSTGSNFVRTAVGGLFMTCGLAQVGPPCRDGEEDLPLHGRAHHTPARLEAAEGRWQGDEYEMRISGVVEEFAVIGKNLQLQREIRSRIGSNQIHIHDRVENVSFELAPHMILYHFNFGFPLMSEATRIRFPSARVIDRKTRGVVDGADHWEAPEVARQERVFYHEQLLADAQGNCSAVIFQPNFPVVAGTVPLEVRLTWNARQLPELTQWRMPGAANHVLGIEPGNCRVQGRQAERRRGGLVTLQPGESRQYDLTLGCLVTVPPS